MSTPSPQALCEHALKLAREAGEHTLKYFQRPDNLGLEKKGDGSPVTVADKEAEAIIRRGIDETFPAHAILGEEEGAKEGTAGTRWFVDPIDGTKSFVAGVPLYSNLVAVEDAGRIVAGVANFPALDLCLWAWAGGGCWANDVRQQVSSTSSLADALMGHIDAASFRRISPAKGEAFNGLANKTYYNAGWCDAYGYALVAMGRIDIAIDPIINPYDIAPFVCILPEAGGYFGDWAGRSNAFVTEAVGTNAALKDEVLGLLKPAAG